MFWTLLVSNFDKSIDCKCIQSSNIFAIFKTLLVLKLDKSNEVKEWHSSNKASIFSTFSVFIFPKLIFCKEEQSKNIKDISLLFLKSKWDISISLNNLHEENKPEVSSTLAVLKFLMFNSFIPLQNWNIWDIFLTLLVSKLDKSINFNE